jgi:hypothetical protein
MVLGETDFVVLAIHEEHVKIVLDKALATLLGLHHVRISVCFTVSSSTTVRASHGCIGIVLKLRF